jgi:tetratricopeptide (TPR) repeat protein
MKTKAVLIAFGWALLAARCAHAAEGQDTCQYWDQVRTTYAEAAREQAPDEVVRKYRILAKTIERLPTKGVDPQVVDCVANLVRIASRLEGLSQHARACQQRYGDTARLLVEMVAHGIMADPFDVVRGSRNARESLRADLLDIQAALREWEMQEEATRAAVEEQYGIRMAPLLGPDGATRRASLPWSTFRRTKEACSRGVAACEQVPQLAPRLAAAYVTGAAYNVSQLHDRAIADCTAQLRSEPAQAAAYLVCRAVAYGGKSEYDRAIADCDQALAKTSDYAFAYAVRGRLYANKQSSGKASADPAADKKSYARAIADLDTALRLDPQNALTYVIRGEVHRLAGAFAEQVADYDKAIQLDPEELRYYSNRGFAHAAQGQFDQAVADFTTVLERGPRNAEVLAVRGAAYFEKGERDRGLAEIRRAMRLDPKSAKIRRMYGDGLCAQGDVDHAIASYDEAIRLDPKMGRAYLARGLARLRQAKPDLDAALADLSESLRVEPHNAQVLATRAEVYRHKREYDMAIADCTAALEVEPTNFGAYAARGAAYSEKGDPDHALADANAALRLNPAFAPAYFVRAHASAKKGDYARCIAECDEALRLDPHNEAAAALRDVARVAQYVPPAQAAASPTPVTDAQAQADGLYNTGRTLLAQGQTDGAIAAFSAVLRLDPKDAWAYFKRGDAHAAKGEMDQAIADYDAAVALDSANAGVYHARALALTAKGAYNKSIADHAASVRLNPNRADYWNAAAWLLATCPEKEQRNGRQAIAYAKKACELSSWREAHCVDTLAAAYAADGQFEEAIRWQKQALELAPEASQRDMRSRMELFQKGKPYYAQLSPPSREPDRVSDSGHEDHPR